MIFIYQCPDFCIASSLSEKNINNNQQKNLGILAFHPVNQLMITSAITKLKPFTKPYKDPLGKQIHMYGFYTAHRKFTFTNKDKFQDQWTLIQKMQNAQVKIQQINSLVMNLKEILYQGKKIGINKQLYPTRTIAMTFLNPVGEANPCVWFVYSPKKICNHTRRKVSVSMNADQVNSNKQVNNKWL